MQPPVATAARSQPTNAQKMAGCGLLVVIILVVGGIIAAVANGGKTSTSTSSNAAAPTSSVAHTATPEATATATPTPDIAPYVNAVQNGAGDLAKALGGEGACGAGNVRTCRAAAVAVQASTEQFIATLSNLQAPPSLAKADALLRQSLSTFLAGTKLQIKGIDDGDATEITAGSSQVGDANTLATQAATEIAKATP